MDNHVNFSWIPGRFCGIVVWARPFREIGMGLKPAYVQIKNEQFWKRVER